MNLQGVTKIGADVQNVAVGDRVAIKLQHSIHFPMLP